MFLQQKKKPLGSMLTEEQQARRVTQVPAQQTVVLPQRRRKRSVGTFSPPPLTRTRNDAITQQRSLSLGREKISILPDDRTALTSDILYFLAQKVVALPNTQAVVFDEGMYIYERLRMVLKRANDIGSQGALSNSYRLVALRHAHVDRIINTIDSLFDRLLKDVRAAAEQVVEHQQDDELQNITAAYHHLRVLREKAATHGGDAQIGAISQQMGQLTAIMKGDTTPTLG